MRARDISRFAWRALTAHRGRTLLVVLAMAIGDGQLHSDSGAAAASAAEGDGGRSARRSTDS